MPELVFQFAEALRSLLAAGDPQALEGRWTDLDICDLGWSALARARREQVGGWEPALDEVDGLLLRLLDRLPVVASGRDPEATRFRTFRLPELERLQHAAAAALVVQRFGIAGLRTVLEDQAAPIGRRYFAFLALAERHPGQEWPLFARYLTPAAHHAFVGAAVEAARFYRTPLSARLLVSLFNAIRDDLHLRAFLSPRILESLHVLEDPDTLPFLHDLLTCGFTNADPRHCEVTRALVMVRRLTGDIQPSSKYRNPDDPEVVRALDEAERLFEREREVVQPVAVI